MVPEEPSVLLKWLLICRLTIPAVRLRRRGTIALRRGPSITLRRRPAIIWLVTGLATILTGGRTLLVRGIRRLVEVSRRGRPWWRWGVLLRWGR